MKKSLLLEALETLDKSERREFSRFVRSPFYNIREDVVQLYDYLAECLWVHRVVPDKEQAFTHLFGPAEYDDHRVRVLMSFLLKLLERFFQHQVMTESEADNGMALARAYRRRQLPRHFRRSLRTAHKEGLNAPYRHSGFFSRQFQLQVEEYQFLASRKRTGEFNLQGIARNLDAWFLSAKLRQACLALSHQAVYRASYGLGMVEELLAFLENSELLKLPAVAIYYHCHRALSEPGQGGHFPRFKQLLFEKGQLFPPEEQQDLYLLGINYCTRRYNEGDGRYLKSQLELYERGLGQGLFIREGRLSRFTYRNIVTLGLILKEYKWVENFLHTYKEKLEPEHRESMFSFCLARLEYSRRHYGRALQLLQQAPFREPLLQLSAKTIIIKIFYETGETGPLDAQMEAMKVFLRRKKAVAYHRENYGNMLRYIRRLEELTPGNRMEKERLKQEILEEKALAERAWLLEQLEARNQ